MNATLTKRNNKWLVEGCEGLSAKEFGSVIDNLLGMPDLRGDTKITIKIGRSYKQVFEPVILSNRDAQGMIYQQILKGGAL